MSGGFFFERDHNGETIEQNILETYQKYGEYQKAGPYILNLTEDEYKNEIKYPPEKYCRLAELGFIDENNPTAVAIRCDYYNYNRYNWGDMRAEFNSVNKYSLKDTVHIADRRSIPGFDFKELGTNGSARCIGITAEIYPNSDGAYGAHRNSQPQFYDCDQIFIERFGKNYKNETIIDQRIDFYRNGTKINSWSIYGDYLLLEIQAPGGYGGKPYMCQHDYSNYLIGATGYGQTATGIGGGGGAYCCLAVNISYLVSNQCIRITLNKPTVFNNKTILVEFVNDKYNDTTKYFCRIGYGSNAKYISSKNTTGTEDCYIVGNALGSPNHSWSDELDTYSGWKFEGTPGGIIEHNIESNYGCPFTITNASDGGNSIGLMHGVSKSFDSMSNPGYSSKLKGDEIKTFPQYIKDVFGYPEFSENVHLGILTSSEIAMGGGGNSVNGTGGHGGEWPATGYGGGGGGIRTNYEGGSVTSNSDKPGRGYIRVIFPYF